MNNVKQYSTPELELFKIRIEQMIEKGKINLQFLIDQINDISENNGNEGDWRDDSSSSSDKEMLTTMERRQRKDLWDLEESLTRIENKTYGICIVTGEKIDKKRLMAVPTTTKSLAAKMEETADDEKEIKGTDKRKEILSRIAPNFKKK